MGHDEYYENVYLMRPHSLVAYDQETCQKRPFYLEVGETWHLISDLYHTNIPTLLYSCLRRKFAWNSPLGLMSHMSKTYLPMFLESSPEVGFVGEISTHAVVLLLRLLPCNAQQLLGPVEGCNCFCVLVSCAEAKHKYLVFFTGCSVTGCQFTIP